MSQTGIVFDIKKFAVHDGPGIRTTIFLKGCELNCVWCHNPESQNFEPEYISKTNCGDNAKELIGKEMSVKEILDEVVKDTIFYDESHGGVTFSGGEPLTQHEFLLSLLKACKKKGIHTALDTSGYAKRNIVGKIVDYVDLFLYDVKLFDEEEHKKYTGVSNKLIIENLQFLDEKEKRIIIRIPIIPEITETEDNIQRLAQFIASLKNVKRVDLLPYNKIGQEKYNRLGREYKLNKLEPLSDEHMILLKEKFEKLGLKTKIGG